MLAAAPFAVGSVAATAAATTAVAAATVVAAALSAAALSAAALSAPTVSALRSRRATIADEVVWVVVLSRGRLVYYMRT